MVDSAFGALEGLWYESWLRGSCRQKEERGCENGYRVSYARKCAKLWKIDVAALQGKFLLLSGKIEWVSFISLLPHCRISLLYNAGTKFQQAADSNLNPAFKGRFFIIITAGGIIMETHACICQPGRAAWFIWSIQKKDKKLSLICQLHSDHFLRCIWPPSFCGVDMLASAKQIRHFTGNKPKTCLESCGFLAQVTSMVTKIGAHLTDTGVNSRRLSGGCRQLGHRRLVAWWLYNIKFECNTHSLWASIVDSTATTQVSCREATRLQTIWQTNCWRFPTNCCLYKCRRTVNTLQSRWATLLWWARLVCNATLCKRGIDSTGCQLLAFWSWSNGVAVCGGISATNLRGSGCFIVSIQQIRFKDDNWLWAVADLLRAFKATVSKRQWNPKFTAHSHNNSGHDAVSSPLNNCSSSILYL